MTMIPVLIYGVPYGLPDLVHHVQIANAYYHSLSEGVLFPGWVAGENNGYGAVTVRFYPPLMHYTLAIFRLTLGNWHLATFAAFAFWSAIGNLGVWLWSMELGLGRRQAVIAAVIFALAPYHLNQFYNAFMYGEFVSLAVLPFCFLFSERVCKAGSALNIASFSISLSFLLLANLPQAVIGSICVGIYLLFLLRRGRLTKQMLSISVAGVIAVGTTAFFWVRTIFEMSWLKISQPEPNPLYNYRKNFLFTDIFAGQGLWLGTLIAAGIILIILLALYVSGRFRLIATDRRFLPIVALSIFSIFMTLPASRPIWDELALLQRLQFPWRFLSILSLTASIIFGYCFSFLNAANFRANRPKAIILVGLFCIFATFSVKQIMFGADFLPAAEFEEMVDRSSSSVGLYHWHPVWIARSAFEQKDKVIAGERPVSIRVWNSTEIRFEVESGHAETVRVALMYYPHWRAFVNSSPVVISPSKDDEISIPLSADQSDVKIEFVEPQYTLTSRWISLVACLLTALALVVYFIFSTKRLHN